MLSVSYSGLSWQKSSSKHLARAQVFESNSFSSTKRKMADQKSLTCGHAWTIYKIYPPKSQWHCGHSGESNFPILNLPGV